MVAKEHQELMIAQQALQDIVRGRPSVYGEQKMEDSTSTVHLIIHTTTDIGKSMIKPLITALRNQRIFQALTIEATASHKGYYKTADEQSTHIYINKEAFARFIASLGKAANQK